MQNSPIVLWGARWVGSHLCGTPAALQGAGGSVGVAGEEDGPEHRSPPLRPPWPWSSATFLPYVCRIFKEGIRVAYNRVLVVSGHPRHFFLHLLNRQADTAERLPPPTGDVCSGEPALSVVQRVPESPRWPQGLRASSAFSWLSWLACLAEYLT